MKKHLAIFTPSVITAILSGKKTIETRFSKNKIAPFLQITNGDIVYVKAPGEDIIAQFRVKKVMFFDNYQKSDFDQLMLEYGAQISWGNPKEEERFKKEKRETGKFATLIWVSEVEQFIVPPVRIRKSDNRAWVVLDEA